MFCSCWPLLHVAVVLHGAGMLGDAPHRAKELFTQHIQNVMQVHTASSIALQNGSKECQCHNSGSACSCWQSDALTYGNSSSVFADTMFMVAGSPA
jgi:hypothetical protein